MSKVTISPTSYVLGEKVPLSSNLTRCPQKNAKCPALKKRLYVVLHSFKKELK